MQKLLREYMDELNKRHKKNRRTGIAVLVLVVIVFGSVMGVLTQYGVAMTGRPQCGMEEHMHTEECYEKTLICGQEETEGHEHTEECYAEPELICGQEDVEGHEHTEECYAEPELICGEEESEGHTHTDECYEETLICGKEEHIHTDECYIDAEADVEDPAAWDSQYAETEWKNAWGEDLAAAAQMQIGYQESTENCTEAADGSQKGYTRYGHFAGDMYADWDAAFVNFCLHYAGLESSGMFPAETNAAAWYEKFAAADGGNYNAYVTTPENYTPAVGDIVFFQKENEETTDQMGIVSSVNEENRTVAVIEGNCANEVRETEYSLDDTAIVRYITVSAMEAAYKNQADSQAVENTGEEADGSIVSPDETQLATTENGTRTLSAAGADYTVTVSFTEEAQIPDNAVLDVREIAPDTEEYQQYYEQSLTEMGVGSFSFARCFDITFLVDGTEIEPAAPVDVKIIYDQAIENSENEIRKVVHFAEDGTEVIGSDVDEEENSVSFTQNSFSVIVDASANKNVYVEELESNIDVSTIDGQSFYVACKDGGTANFLGNEPETIRTAVNNNGEPLVGLKASRTLWKFEQKQQSEKEFYISADGKYLKIESYVNGEASLKTVDRKEDASVFEVESDVHSRTVNSQKVGITIKCQLDDGIDYYINLSGAREDVKIFAGWKDADDNSILTLCQKFTPTPVASISTKNLITMKMQDYSNYASAKNDGTTFSPFVLSEGEGSTVSASSNESGLRQGILNNKLEEEGGYPTFLQGYDYEQGQKFDSLNGQSLGRYFSNAQDVDGLFQKVGDYYEYDSNENAAVLDSETGNFTLYKELITSYYKNNGDKATYRRGNFLPYDTFENGLLSISQTEDGKNLFLPDSGGEEWYQKDQGTANYHFGMEMETTFYQMKDGKVGNDNMVYTFKGDDDLWVYIDGVLVLDIGGCHGSIEGTIDFATGIVTINTTGCGDTYFGTSALYTKKSNTEYTTTLTKCFRAAYGDGYVFNPSEWKSIGDDNWIFADYTKHTFNMWYMERGSAVSNLKLKFNLAMIPEGEVQITKTLENLEQTKYANENFGFQVFLQPIKTLGDGSKNDEFDDGASEKAYRPLCMELKENGRTNVTAYVQVGEKKYLYQNEPDDKGHYYIEIPENEKELEEKLAKNLPFCGEENFGNNGEKFDNNNQTDAVFYLKPGETLILEGLKDNRKYYVREVGVDSALYSKVKIGENTYDFDSENGNNGAVMENGGKKSVQTDAQRVSEKQVIEFINRASEDNSNQLIIKKELKEGHELADSTDKFTFKVWLEDQNGVLVPYVGNYTIIRATTEDATTEEGTTKDGRIPGIGIKDEVVIDGILAGTDYLVEEDLREYGDTYATPDVKSEDVSKQPETESETSGSGTTESELVDSNPVATTEGQDGQDGTPATGYIKVGCDAEVTVTNSRNLTYSWEIRKKSSTTPDGGFLAGAQFRLTGIKESGATKAKNTEEATEPVVYYGESSSENDTKGVIMWYEDENHTNSVGKIAPGKYRLEETVAPAGYLINGEAWVLEIKPNNDITITKETEEEGTDTGVKYDENLSTNDVDALNGSNKVSYVFIFEDDVLYELPSTGGSGIYWYMFSGILLMAGATLFLYKNKVQGGAGKLD